MLTTLLMAAAISQPQLPPPPPPSLPGEVMAKVSPERCRETVDTLVGFGTRHTLSETESDTRGIGAARRWVAEQFRAAAPEDNPGAIEVSFDRFTQPAGRRIPAPTEIVNVVARIPGSMPEAAGREYLVLAHLDSRASDGMDAESDAPGANDDGSGVAVLIELAHVLVDAELDSTVVLIATSGEEQGLYGARHYAEQAKKEGRDIRAVLNNDMVGDPGGPIDPDGTERRAPELVRVFSEGLPIGATTEEAAAIRRLSSESDSTSRELARAIAEISAREQTAVKPFLIFRPDRFLRGGDHTAFNEMGYPAVRFTVVHENYDRQHQDVREEDGVQYGDLPEHVDAEYLANVARLNAAVLVHLANAPSAPTNVRMLTAELSPNTTLRWDPSPEPDVAGYEVVWRDTISATWDWANDVGDRTEYTMALSKDNLFFGVRAYDSDGYRSPVVFATAAKE